MIERFGDMWEAFDDADLFLFTGNSFITKEGKLVMGRGMAKQVRDAFPGIDLALGDVIPHLGTYGVATPHNVIPHLSSGKVGAFQVKNHWKSAASLDLIRTSCLVLTDQYLRRQPEWFQVHMNYPGIGNGRLSIETVRPIIQMLPDNVYVWRYK